MPSVLTYPGVYVEEKPSGVRTVVGVATSIAAFVGAAARGPVGQAVVINSYADFERLFGGLWLGGALGYAVRDFYLNGGAQAVIVRLVAGPAAAPLGGAAAITAPAKAALSIDTLKLEAASEGTWGNALRGRVDDDVSKALKTAFNLTVRDGKSGTVEMFRNLTVEPGPRQVGQVLKNESKLVRLVGKEAAAKPKNHDDLDPKKRQDPWKDDKLSTPAANGEDGGSLTADDFIGPGTDVGKTGLYALRDADLFNLLCIPPFLEAGEIDPTIVAPALAFCAERRALLLIDPRATWTDKDSAKKVADFAGPHAENGAFFFPRLLQPDPLRGDQTMPFAPCGAVAGVFARTDTTRGVWKAPAGLDATLGGVPQLEVALTDLEIGELNPLGVNCLRTVPAAGRVVWGARTLAGNDRLASEWKYIPVRRTALFIEESLYRATQWIVFEPNDEPLWSQVRLNIGAFMHDLFRKGAFQGTTPKDAYFVKCDKETTTQSDINLGIVNIVVGFAPLKPAEFVVIQIQQMAGQIDV